MTGLWLTALGCWVMNVDNGTRSTGLGETARTGSRGTYDCVGDDDDLTAMSGSDCGDSFAAAVAVVVGGFRSVKKTRTKMPPMSRTATTMPEIRTMKKGLESVRPAAASIY